MTNFSYPTTSNSTPNRAINPANEPPAALVFDAARYQHLLDDPSATPEESEAYLKAIWDIVVLVLDFGLRIEFKGIHPQDGQNRSKELDAALGNMVSSQHSVLIDTKTKPAARKRTVKGCFDDSC